MQSAKATSEAPKTGYGADPKSWNLMVFCFHALSFTFFFVRWLFSFGKGQSAFTKGSGAKKIGSSPILEAHPLSDEDKKKQKEASERIKNWMDVGIVRSHTSCQYSTAKDVFETAVVSSTFAAHGAFSAFLFKRSENKISEVIEAKIAVQSIIEATDKSEKYTKLLQSIRPFLNDIVKASPASLVDLLSYLAQDMLARPRHWYIEFLHSELRSSNIGRVQIERNMGTLSLFFKEGAGLDALFVKKDWSGDMYAINSVLTLLMYASIERCSVKKYIQLEAATHKQKGGTEVFLQGDMEFKFFRFVSLSSTKCDSLFRDKMMWDVTVNLCNEYIALAWKDETLERAMWVLQHGKQSLKRNMYLTLKTQKSNLKLDLTVFKGLDLLALSIAGIINVKAREGALFQITGDCDAEIQINGHVPKVTVDDLLQLGICKKISEGVYEMLPIPGFGTNKLFKAVAVGDRLLLVQSGVSKQFKGKVSQTIG